MTTGSSTPGSNRFALVGCGSAKQDTPAPARKLYTSTYFSLKRQYAVEHADSWRILSAKHGLVDPDEPIAPYDVSLSTRSDSYIGDDVVAQWSEHVRADLEAHLTECDPTPTVVVLAGEDYARLLDPLLEQSRFDVEWLFRQDELEGIGDRMHWLSEQTGDLPLSTPSEYVREQFGYPSRHTVDRSVQVAHLPRLSTTSQKSSRNAVRDSEVGVSTRQLLTSVHILTKWSFTVS